MIIHLYGPDSYRRIKKVEELVSAYQKKHGKGDFLLADLEEEEWNNVGDFLNQQSIFVDTKVALIKEGASVKDKGWVSLVKEQINNSDTFLIMSDKDKPSPTFSFLLEKPVKSQEFKELEGKDLKNFILKEASLRGIEFGSSAFDFIFRYTSSFPEGRGWLLTRELDKISAANLSKKVSFEEIGRFIKWAPEENFFQEVSGLTTRKDPFEKLSILERLLLKKEEPAYIFNILGNRAKDEMAEKLASYDISVKSGKLDYESVLTDLAITGIN